MGSCSHFLDVTFMSLRPAGLGTTRCLWLHRWSLGWLRARAASILGWICSSSVPECSLTQLLWSPELEPVQAAQNKTGKYVPPSLRDGASRRGESMQPNRRGEWRVGTP